MLLVLCYHDIDPVEGSPWVLHPERLREQIIAVREMGYEIISLDRISDSCNIYRKCAVITFDDGRAGCYMHALPVLRELNCPAAFFVCPGFTVGNAEPHEQYTQFMTCNQLRELADAGYIVGAHSNTHQSFTKLSVAEIYSEVQFSMDWVSTLTGYPCRHFAVPYGDGGEVAAGIVKASGASTCLFTGEQINYGKINPWLLQRVSVESPCTLEMFKAKVAQIMQRNKTPEFSFIIPVKNNDPMLAETIRNIRKLGDRAVAEIVVVYDGDVPKYIRDVEEMAETYYTHSEGRGVAAARNTGAALARGRVLVFTDAHVCFSANFLDVLRSSDVSHSRGIRGCTTRIIKDYAQFRRIADSPRTAPFELQDAYYGWRVSIKNGQFATDTVGERVRDDWFRVPYVGACALAISKSMFDHLGKFDSKLVGAGSMEDCELAMRCWLAGLDVQTTPNAVCWHFTSNNTPVPSKHNKHAAIDDPRYPGETLNTVRLLGLHYPASVAVPVVDRFNKECQRHNIPDCRDTYGDALLETASSHRNLLMTPQRFVAVMAGEGLEK